jgi:tetratricopeptide (TPR) repeat protein
VGGEDPKDHVAVLHQLSVAQNELARGKPEEALAALEDAGEQGASVEALRASAALLAGRYALAEEAARGGVIAQPGRSDIWVILGRALELLGRHEEAAEAFETAVRLDPSSGPPHLGLGRRFERGGELGAAAASYQRAHEAGVAEAGWRLAALHIEAGRDDAARALLGSLAASTLNDPSAVLRLAGAEANRGLEEASLRRLASALARQPSEPRLAVAMATVHLARGEPAQALIVVEAVEPPGHPDLEIRLGLARARAQAELGDPDVARRTLDESLARAEGARDAFLAEARRFRATLGP